MDERDVVGLSGSAGGVASGVGTITAHGRAHGRAPRPPRLARFLKGLREWGGWIMWGLDRLLDLLLRSLFARPRAES